MSKARLFQAVKAPDLEKVKALLEADPALRQVTDERRRNALHLLCGLPANEKTRARSLRLAEYLLGAGSTALGPPRSPTTWGPSTC